MKIRIEITSEEVAKGMELTSTILPGINVSEYMPTEHQELEAKCNAYEMSNVVDPEAGVITEIEFKTHFVVWLLRKCKPFITACVSLFHMLTDFAEDIQLMMGEVSITHNGEDLAEKLSKIAEDAGCSDDEDDDEYCGDLHE